ncbi:hypothetical protein BDR06DRAFT_966037 [Suillus hirtellus]|nr:hypothetical protein BDR06DRAFT_966037 [Suillus hirtellus]
MRATEKYLEKDSSDFHFLVLSDVGAGVSGFRGGTDGVEEELMPAGWMGCSLGMDFCCRERVAVSGGGEIVGGEVVGEEVIGKEVVGGEVVGMEVAGTEVAVVGMEATVVGVEGCPVEMS